MAVIKVNPMKLLGPWAVGYVLDYHSISATPTGDPYHPFEMKYSELGGRLYRFKYKGDRSVLPDLIDTADHFIKGLNITIDIIVPAPPSMRRSSQPVLEFARELGNRLERPVAENVVAKSNETPSMKNIPDWLERQKVLGDAINAGSDKANDRSVLIVDDLVESGSTLRRTADVLLNDCKAKAVYALALTRTR